MASICNGCAEKRGGKAGEFPCTAWQGECEFCHGQHICVDTRDWRLDDEGNPRKPMTTQQAIGSLCRAMADEEIKAGIKSRRNMGLMKRNEA